MLYCTRNPTLKKPEYADGVDIEDINDNMDFIDAILSKNNTNGATDPIATDDAADGYSACSWWSNISGHKFFACEDADTGAAVWRQVWPPLTTDLSGTITNAQLAGSISNDKLAGSISNDKLLSSDGWIVAPTLTYVSADAPSYVVTASGDYSTIIMAGMKMKMTQSASVKYFIVTKSVYSSPNTTITLYGGTDYTLGATITLPYYSMMRSPAGFPMSSTKWTVELSDANDTYQNTPTKNTKYNIGGLQLSIPIGEWDVTFQCVAVCQATSGIYTDVYAGVSTSTSSFSNVILKGRGYLGGAEGGIFIGNITRTQHLSVAAKTLYYVLVMTDLDNQTLIGVNGATDASTVLSAVCSYCR
jgi:hypothetical protein